MLEEAPDIIKHYLGWARVSALSRLRRRPAPSALVERIHCNGPISQRREEVIIGVAVIGEAVYKGKASSDSGPVWRLKSELERVPMKIGMGINVGKHLIKSIVRRRLSQENIRSKSWCKDAFWNLERTSPLSCLLPSLR